jgi:phage/plasmid-like protein (TIGR03299 family)
MVSTPGKRPGTEIVQEDIMVAGIENINGVGSFVSARQDAWHKLGVVLEDTFTAEEAMQHALLGGWNVRKLPLFAKEITLSESGVTEDIIGATERFMTVRTNPVTGKAEYLGDVGSRYTVIQNEEHAEFLNLLVDESGAHFETAGSLFGGKRVFISMKLPNHIDVGGDVTDLYLIALNSHDGTSEFQVCVSAIRPVCHNTVTAAFRGAKSTFSIRHTRNAMGRVQDAREALGMSFKWAEAYQATGEALLAQSFTDTEFENFLASLFDVADTAPEDISSRKSNQMDAVRNLWQSSPTLLGTKGTRYGAYQAFTEYSTHFAAAHGKTADAQAINRAQRDVFDTKSRTRALELLTA